MADTEWNIYVAKDEQYLFSPANEMTKAEDAASPETKVSTLTGQVLMALIMENAS